MRLSVAFLSKRVNQSSLTNELLIQIGFYCISTFFSRQKLSFFTGFLLEQLNQEVRWDAAFSEVSYPSMYQNVTEGKFMFLLIECSKLSKYYYLQPGCSPSVTDFFEAMDNLIQERHNHSESCITVKVSWWAKKAEIYLAKEESGLAFFSTDLGHILKAMLAMNVDWCWEEKDFTNQNLFTTSSAYTLSRYRENWLSTILLTTQKLHCCVVFLFFPN